MPAVLSTPISFLLSSIAARSCDRDVSLESGFIPSNLPVIRSSPRTLAHWRTRRYSQPLEAPRRLYPTALLAFTRLLELVRLIGAAELGVRL